MSSNFLRPNIAAQLASGFLCCVLLAGCPESPAKPQGNGAAEAAPAVAIRVVVVGDAHLATTIEREWRARSEDELTLKSLSAEELLSAKRLNADVLVLPAELLGDLAEAQRLMPFPDAALTDPEMARATFFPHLRTEFCAWGKQTYALPLGGPTLQLLYRADIFEKLGLQPPTTWAEYQELLPKLADRAALGELAPPEDAAWNPTVEPLAPGWAGKLLLARSAAYVADASQSSLFIDLTSLEPRLATPPLEKALTELATAAQDQPSWLKLTPDLARAELLGGRTAMALAWPSGVRSSDAGTTAKLPTIRIAALPGAKEFYSASAKKWQPREGGATVPYLGAAGSVAAVAKDCRRPSVALKFVNWLTGPESSDRISPQSIEGSPTRTTQASRAGRWIDAGLDSGLGSDYFALLQADQSRPAFLAPLRLPGQASLLAALDDAVSQTLRGDAQPEAALQSAADKWKTHFSKDAEAYRKQARRSLNLSQ